MLNTTVNDFKMFERGGSELGCKFSVPRGLLDLSMVSNWYMASLVIKTDPVVGTLAAQL